MSDPRIRTFRTRRPMSGVRDLESKNGGRPNEFISPVFSLQWMFSPVPVGVHTDNLRFCARSSDETGNVRVYKCGIRHSLAWFFMESGWIYTWKNLRFLLRVRMISIKKLSFIFRIFVDFSTYRHKGVLCVTFILSSYFYTACRLRQTGEGSWVHLLKKNLHYLSWLLYTLKF